jgi:hypothetical protein
VDDDPEEELLGIIFWEAEERFLGCLSRFLGRDAEWFEVLDRDDVVITVEGRPVTFVENVLTVDIQEAGS